MNDILHFLQQRQSSARLEEPAPGPSELHKLYEACMRVPDHAQLKPVRWLQIVGEARQQLGEVFAEAAKHQDPAVEPARLEKCRAMPLRAPMILVVIATLRVHPKVDETEQLMSAACSTYSILLGLEAAGFGGIWRTGEFASHPHVLQALGVGEKERLVAYLYVGTPEKRRPVNPAIPAYAERVRTWPAGG